eukprot:NODE_4769_length_554_cov_101.546535_g3482_i0.p5 GENE.NODE_4769_length_554_cov_101.546535_g3482_i0~~NODE_4769_length_554_cov_101.546535_g3482_i0.p5  ORF type:complete len:58 (-),score=10.27 NODE_4769_length_554_cov_101.546535_g3482_i0:26-199(-)
MANRPTKTTKRRLGSPARTDGRTDGRTAPEARPSAPPKAGGLVGVDSLGEHPSEQNK